MNESTLQSGLMKALREGLPGSVVFHHSDKITSGIPDISVSWAGRTTFLEVKYANPKFNARGVQTEIIKRLSRVTFCYYVIYRNHKGFDTLIVDPKLMVEDSYQQSIRHSSTIDHKLVADFIRETHK